MDKEGKLPNENTCLLDNEEKSLTGKYLSNGQRCVVTNGEYLSNQTKWGSHEWGIQLSFTRRHLKGPVDFMPSRRGAL